VVVSMEQLDPQGNCSRLTEEMNRVLKKKKEKNLTACRGLGRVAGPLLAARALPLLLGQVAPAGVPLAVSPAGAGLRRITLYQLSRLWANALAV
jgi:hypothetical protein